MDYDTPDCRTCLDRVCPSKQVSMSVHQLKEGHYSTPIDMTPTVQCSDMLITHTHTHRHVTYSSTSCSPALVVTRVLTDVETVHVVQTAQLLSAQTLIVVTAVTVLLKYLNALKLVAYASSVGGHPQFDN